MFEPARRVASWQSLAAGSARSAYRQAAAVAQAPPPRPPRLQVPSSEPRYAAIVLDASSGEVLYEKRADSPRYPASITKIMTMYLAFEALATGHLKETDLITVSARAAAQAPTKLGLRPGETISVEDAMHAIAVKSANDMAVALAEKIGGTEPRFAAMMTLRAQELGMVNTRFVNANGLPDSRQVTTARDIAILSRAVMRDYPQYYSYFSQEQFTFRGQTMNNHNGLLGKMPGVDGLKTGFTNAAGFNLDASAMRNGHRLITVVMGGTSGASRNANVEDLLLTGFDVEERRARGEQILVTQNLFEPAARWLASAAAADRTGRWRRSHRHGADPPRARHAGDHRPTGMAAPPRRPVPCWWPAMVADLGGSHAAFAAEPAPGRAPPAQASTRRTTGRSRSAPSESDREATRQVETVADKFSRLFDDRRRPGEPSGGRAYPRSSSPASPPTKPRRPATPCSAKDLPCLPLRRGRRLTAPLRASQQPSRAPR